MGFDHTVDETYLREAIRLSREKMDAGEGGPFGAVVVRGDEVIGRGWNRVTSTCDPTAHAEITAIREACSRLETFSLEGCRIYSSCEPCPMCFAAILWARIGSVFYAASCEDAAAAGFDDRKFYQEICKAVEQRETPVRQLLRDEANLVFDAWRAKPDKVAY
ncbi:MAG: nucleoside deaminase [Planctomyces sp.]|nr:nucleoside deaminase [Planctomyces sp.]